MNKKLMVLSGLFLAIVAFAFHSFAVPRFNNDPHNVTHTGTHSFKGGMTLAPAGTDDITLTTDADTSLVVTGLTDVSGDAICVSSGNVFGTCAAAVFTTSVSAPALVSPVSGSADDITISPAGTGKFKILENSAIQIMVKVTSHSACAAAGDVGKIELYDNGADKISLCGCVQTAAATFAWEALNETSGAC